MTGENSGIGAAFHERRRAEVEGQIFSRHLSVRRRDRSDGQDRGCGKT
jgi:hypothetical protein